MNFTGSLKLISLYLRRGGGIGRRARLKIVWAPAHESSILSRGIGIGK